MWAIAGLGVWGLACGEPPALPALPPSVDEFASDPALLALQGAAEGLSYAGPDDHLSPVGVYLDDGSIWVWSASQPRRVGRHGGPIQAKAPAPTRRCGPGFCVGAREIVWRGTRIRGWFRDGAPHGDHFYALTRDALLTFDDQGIELARTAVPTAYRLGQMGAALWVLGGDPELTVVPLDPSGLPGDPVTLQRTAPLRDAAWDGERLWTVGPLDTPVRRDGGPVRDLRTEVTALAGSDLLQGRLRVLERHDWGELAIDGTRIVAEHGVVRATATGSGHVWTLSQGVVTVQETCATPSGVALDGPDAWIVSCRLDDAVAHSNGVVIPLDDTPRDTLADAGERLFYQVGLWPDTTFTCNSCHWDGSTDHRLQPGFEERRWELTRPVAGTGALSPIFSPGQSPDLAHAVEGLVRVLDPRAWSDPRGGWWAEPRTIRTDSGTRTLTALQVREALLRWILGLGLEPPFVETQVAPASLALFVDECTHCHQPVADLHTRTPQSPETRPLVWAAPLFAKVGPPPFTDRGNRVSPLTNLARGGPYFTDGSARTLEDVVRAKGDYSDDQVAMLVEVLLSL